MKDLTTYENEFDAAVENNKIVFYDYLNYKMHIGWNRDFKTFTWNKVNETKSAIYDSKFIEELPDIYFLGVSIKNLVKREISNGFCYTIILALSLCYNDFKIVTANLNNYVGYYKKHIEKDCEKFEHCFLLIDCNSSPTVIDTSWGIITDYETYDKVMKLSKVKFINKEEIFNTQIYDFLNKNKYIQQLTKEETEKIILKYIMLCMNYQNPSNKYLQDFFNKKLLYDLDNKFFDVWNNHIFNDTYNRIVEYPKYNMFSLIDEEKDEFLFDLNKPLIKK